jgi:hypothetical protein
MFIVQPVTSIPPSYCLPEWSVPRSILIFTLDPAQFMYLKKTPWLWTCPFCGDLISVASWFGWQYSFDIECVLAFPVSMCCFYNWCHHDAGYVSDRGCYGPLRTTVTIMIFRMEKKQQSSSARVIQGMCITPRGYAAYLHWKCPYLLESSIQVQDVELQCKDVLYIGTLCIEFCVYTTCINRSTIWLLAVNWAEKTSRGDNRGI